MTETQLRWLERTGKVRCALFELTFLGAGAGSPVAGVEYQAYVSNMDYVTRATDTPAHQIFDSCVIDTPSFTRRMGEQLEGRSTQSFGDLLISNEYTLSDSGQVLDPGIRDDWLAMNWDGRRIRMWIGDPGWAFEDFILVLDGRIVDIFDPGGYKLGFKISDKAALLDRPVMTTLLGGSGPNAGQLMPLTLGHSVYNIDLSAQIIDQINYVYRITATDPGTEELPVTGETVWVDGFAVTYVLDPDAGTVELDASPTGGRVTMESYGLRKSGVIQNSVSEVVQQVFTSTITNTPLTLADLDTDSLDALEAVEGEQHVGIYLAERMTFSELLDKLLMSIGGWWGFSRTGLLQVGRLDLPVPGSPPAPVYSFIDDDIARRSLRLSRRILPKVDIKLLGTKNYTPLTYVAGGVTPFERAQFTRANLQEATGSATVTTWDSDPENHLSARRSEPWQTYLIDGTQLQNEADRLATLFQRPNAVWTFQTHQVAYLLQIGDLIYVESSRYTGYGTVVELTEKLKGRSEVSFFAQLTDDYSQGESIPPIGTPVVDSDFSDVVLLLHGDGTNGSEDIVDSSSYARVMDANLGAILSSTEKKFGATSLKFVRATASSIVTNPFGAAELTLGAGDYTIEWWQYGGPEGGFVSNRPDGLPAPPPDGFTIWYSDSGNYFQFLNNDGNNVSRWFVIPSAGAWHHVAFCRISGVHTMYLDGTLVTKDISNNESRTWSYNTFTLGQMSTGAPLTDYSALDGYLDEVRITKGVGRYTGNFTPPTAAFPDQ